LADLYLLAIQKANAGSFFFAENGESTLLGIVCEESLGGLRATA
jgi:hypothetical protein